MGNLRSCPRCRALYESTLADCPECGQSIRPRLARERGGLFDGLSRRGLSAVWLLILANGALYGLCLLRAKGLAVGGQSITGLGEVPGRVIFSLGGLTYDGVVHRHEFWRLVCPIFLHFNLMHILFNCFVIHSAGRVAEEAFGSAKFFALFLLSGIAGSLASLAWHGGGFWIGAGASGAGFGILGMAAVYALRTRDADLRQFMVRWAVIGLVLGFVVDADNAAHVGGLAAGALFGRFAATAVRTRLSWLRVRLWDAAAVGAVLLVLGSFAAAVLAH